MIRLAIRSDIPRIHEIRDSRHDNPLSNPNAVTEADVAWSIDNRALWVWEEVDGLLTGFSAGDVRDGSIRALLVAPGHEAKGIGRALLNAVCDMLRQSGHRLATLCIEAGTQAERHYRADGWTVTGSNQKGELVFRKPL